MPESSRILVIGLPGAGKTTFIAALWHVLSTEKIAGALVLDELQPDRAHLNGIAKLWRECKKIPRTTLPKERTVTLNLRVPESEVVHHISFPDASGEGFRRIFEKRKWSPDFAQLVNEASSLLFFIHPSSLVGAHRIDANIEHMVQTANAEQPAGNAHDPEHSEASEGNGEGVVLAPAMQTQALAEVKQWAVAFAAPQAKLVDLLQIVRAARAINGLKTAVIVSAWDLAKLEKLRPPQWIEKRTPLLNQYLEAGRFRFPYETFGVSAQGADLKGCDSLRDFVRPSERIEVVHGSKSSHDITRPLRWILE